MYESCQNDVLVEFGNEELTCSKPKQGKKHQVESCLCHQTWPSLGGDQARGLPRG